MLSLAVLALYVVPRVSMVAPNGLFGISMVVAVAAGITALASVAAYFFKQKQETFGPSFAVYLLLAITSGLLVLQTGGTGSPFIMLWMLVAFFSALFAVYGWLTVIVASGVLVAIQYLDGDFSANTVAVVAFSSVLPALTGILVWRGKGQLSENEKSVKSLKNELSEVATQSEVVINAIGDGVIAIDAQGTIQLINPAAQEILGWAKQDAMELNYKSVLQIVDNSDKPIDPAMDPVMQVLNTNQMLRSQSLTLKTKSGKKVTSSLVVSPIGNLGSGVITVFRDMTKEKAEEREQAEFISTASHEMRTPVASIEGYLGLALNPNTAQVDAKARDFIMKAHEAAQHLGRLFQDLLDVSKTEDGRMTNIPRVVDIVPFTDMICQGLNQKAIDKGLTLTFKPTDNSNANTRTITPVYFVNQDNDHIREILDNLVENAIKYTPSGTVTVDVGGSDTKVVVSIKDSGLGIPAEDVPHLFQKFYRVDNQDRSSIGGTGLGLYLSRRLAEAMQGRLYVESTHGQGSTFFLELPRISVQEAEQLRAIQAQQMATQPVSPPTQVQPAMPPVVTPRPMAPSAPAAQPPQQAAPEVKAATTVPRGESLTREQIQEHVRQLQAMARQLQPQPRAESTPAVAPVQQAPASTSVAPPQGAPLQTAPQPVPQTPFVPGPQPVAQPAPTQPGQQQP